MRFVFKTLVSSWVLWTAKLQAFVLLSSVEEARINTTPELPEVYFEITTDAPSFSEKDKFLDGSYADEGDLEFWLRIFEEAARPWNEAKGSHLRIKAKLSEQAEINPDDRVFSVAKGSVGLSVAAFAVPRYENGYINDCDIQFGDKSFSATAAAYTLMHEIGHCLGLGHNHLSFDAVMGYSRVNRDLRLGVDDWAGLIYLYPEDGVQKARLDFGCATLGGGLHGSIPSAFHLALLLLPFWGVRLRANRNGF